MESACRIYRPRNPRKTALWGLLDTLYERVKGWDLCPSCGAHRAAELAAFLADEVVEDVGHAQWVFTIPKMLRERGSCRPGGGRRQRPGLAAR